MVDKYLLVDGYNMIFEWETLKKIAKINVEDARIELMDMLCDYAGYKGIELTVVFDAHYVKNRRANKANYKNIKVVYTKEKESADLYIEMQIKRLIEKGGKYSVKVATSDGLEQTIVMSKGALRVTARELEADIKGYKKTFRRDNKKEKKNFLINNVDDETAKILNAIRLGKGWD